jgi:hypothetical protein
MKAVRLAIILGVSLLGTATLTAKDDRDNESVYLALGDSVPFGFMPLPGFEAVNASNFVGYPDYLGRALGLATVNAACPGEASGSFSGPFTADNGCRAYRAQLPLHVAFDGTQEDLAVEFVKANAKTRLVTIQLGANDLFLLAKRCTDVGLPAEICFMNLPIALASLEENILTTIVNLRAAGYRGPIVIVNYFPLDLNDTQATTLTQALNAALEDAAHRGGAILADTFRSFTRVIATPTALGSSCRAGLLKANPANPLTCDVHPSQSGQRLIAKTVAVALRRANDDH